MLRSVVYWVSARCVRWFYREHRIVGRDRIPPSGAVLLIGNHPNDLPDVITGIFTTSRPVRYIATVSVTGNWAARKMYEAMRVIPVTRVRDARAMKEQGVDIAAVNAAAADAVHTALRGGEVVAVFPEGGVHDVPEIGRLRTGVAKMVLESLDDPALADVTVVPVGMQYDAPRRYGSDVLAVIGEPWRVRETLAAASPEQAGPAGLTARFRESLRAVTRNSATWDACLTRDELLAAVAPHLEPGDPLRAVPAMLQKAEQVAAAVHGDGASAAAVRCKTAAHELARAVERAGGVPTSAVDHGRLLFALDYRKPEEPGARSPFQALAPVPTVALWLGGFAAAMGWAVHGPAFWVVRAVAHRIAKDRAAYVARTFVPGLYLIAGWYLVCALGLWAALRAWGFGVAVATGIALLALVGFPRLGDMAVAWQHWLGAWQLVRSVHRWGTAERRALREVAAELATCWQRENAAGRH